MTTTLVICSGILSAIEKVAVWAGLAGWLMLAGCSFSNPVILLDAAIATALSLIMNLIMAGTEGFKAAFRPVTLWVPSVIGLLGFIDVWSH